MPELPEITVYIEALERRVVGQPLVAVRIRSPSLLRTADPPLDAVEGRLVTGLRRMGKRIVFAMEQELFLALHLMIAGRLRWKPPGAAVPRRGAHGALDFPTGTLLITEAGTRKRAALHVVQGEAALSALDPGGIEPLESSRESYARALSRENHTLKRALTDPRVLSGIGNAHSDEILHAARLSPFKRTHDLSEQELTRLYDVTRRSLRTWIERLRKETDDGFPHKVTAFHKDMAVHGRYGKPCPACGSPVQRIVVGEREVNYCARCQTGGRLLRDRALSRLLHENWPATLEELAERKSPR